MSTEFGINFTEKAFNILSSTIYSNKLLAPIRELSTNAWDANEDNGKDGWDFIVHIPNNAIEDFSIRDFGKGISKADMLAPDGIFTTYFKSSKEDGTKTGFMGLGSKSPFAITAVFYVTSWCENYKRTYQLDNSSGKPAIHLKEEEESQEPTGLKISFRIPGASIPSFQLEAKKFYGFWATKPKINLTDFGEVTTVKIGKESYRHTKGTGELVMLMGNTPYSIKPEQIPEKYRGLFGRLNHKIILDAPLGSLNFTASREVLESTKQTLNFIETKLNNLIFEVKEQYKVHNTKKFFTWIKEAPTDPLSLGLSHLYPNQGFGHSNFYGHIYTSNGPWLRGYAGGSYVHKELKFGEGVNLLLYPTEEKEIKATPSKLKYHTEQNPGLWIGINADQIQTYQAYTDEDLTQIVSISSLPKRPRAKSVSTKPRAPRKTYFDGIYTKTIRGGLNFPLFADGYSVTKKHRVTSVPSGIKYFIFLEENEYNTNSLYRTIRYSVLEELFSLAKLSIKELFIIDPVLVDYKDTKEWVWLGDVVDECVKKHAFAQADIFHEKSLIDSTFRDIVSVKNSYSFASNFPEVNSLKLQIEAHNRTLKDTGISIQSLHPIYHSYTPKLSNSYCELRKATTKILECKKRFDFEINDTRNNQFTDWLAKKVINNEQLPWKTQ